MDGAGESGEADAADGAAVAEQEAEGHVDEEAGADEERELVVADEEIAGEEGQQRKDEGDAAIANDGAGKKGDGADGGEVLRVRGEAESACEKNDE